MTALAKQLIVKSLNTVIEEFIKGEGRLVKEDQKAVIREVTDYMVKIRNEAEKI